MEKATSDPGINPLNFLNLIKHIYFTGSTLYHVTVVQDKQNSFSVLS